MPLYHMLLYYYALFFLEWLDSSEWQEKSGNNKWLDFEFIFATSPTQVALLIKCLLALFYCTEDIQQTDAIKKVKI